jgi:hypothetical protein
MLPLVAASALDGATPQAGGDDWRMSNARLDRRGAFLMALPTAPAGMRPALRTFYDAHLGPEADPVLGLTAIDLTLYAFANYPFETRGRPLAGALPRGLCDRQKGYVLFRNGFAGAEDIRAVVYLASEPQGRRRDEPVILVHGLGEAFQPIGLAGGITNGDLGGTILAYEAADDGSGQVAARLDDAYRGAWSARAGEYPDLGVRARRYFAADYSGAAGVPALFVLVDAFAGEGKYPVDAPPVASQAAYGKRLEVTWVARTPRLGFAVITLGEGDPPKMTVSGEGAAATARVGRRTVAFDGERIVLGR